MCVQEYGEVMSNKTDHSGDNSQEKKDCWRYIDISPFKVMGLYIINSNSLTRTN